MVLGFLLARAGIDVTVLEKHPDFNRDFRGDTIHPATLQLLHELGLLEAFLQVPHQEISGLSAHVGGEAFPIADLTHLPTVCKFIALMPQWDFLNFLAAQAKQFPNFHLLMQHRVTSLIHHGGRTVGVVAETSAGPVEVHAPLTVGCDGRHATTTAAAHFDVLEGGVPIDVLWFRVSRKPDDPENALGYFNYGTVAVLIDRNEYWQIAFLIPKGGLASFQAEGLENFRTRLTRLVPFLADRTQEVQDFSQLKLLTVQINRLLRWHAQGLLCIGDAAHAMSPVGGIGINIAIQDAVAAANILTKPLHLATPSRPVPEATLAQVQSHREWAVRLTQAFQVQAHKIIVRVLRNPHAVRAPWVLRFLSSQSWFRRLLARTIGLGVHPEHIQA